MVDKDEFEELLAASQRPREDGEDMRAEEGAAAAAPAAAADDDNDGDGGETGEGPDPDDDGGGDDGGEEGDEGDGDDGEEEDPVGKLPCRRRKQAAAFMRRLASGPQFGLRRGEIYLGGRLLGKVSTVLQHFFGPEKLTASQIRMAESFLSSKSKSDRREGERAPAAPARLRPAAGRDGDDEDDYHPELAAAWQRMGLFPGGQRSPTKKGRGKK